MHARKFFWRLRRPGARGSRRRRRRAVGARRGAGRDRRRSAAPRPPATTTPSPSSAGRSMRCAPTMSERMADLEARLAALAPPGRVRGRNAVAQRRPMRSPGKPRARSPSSRSRRRCPRPITLLSGGGGQELPQPLAGRHLRRRRLHGERCRGAPDRAGTTRSSAASPCRTSKWSSKERSIRTSAARRT